MPRLPLSLSCCLLLLLGCGRIPAADADAGLLDEIFAAQADRQTVWARVLDDEKKVGAPPDDESQRITGWLQVPGRYFLEVIPLFDGEEEDRREWFVSDGRTAWHSVREMEGVPLQEDPPRQLDPEDEDIGGFVRLVTLERADVEERFVVEVQEVDEATRMHPRAVHRLHLVPRAQRLLKHVKHIDVELDAEHVVVALALYDQDGFVRTLLIEEVAFDREPPEGIFTWSPQQP